MQVFLRIVPGSRRGYDFRGEGPAVERADAHPGVAYGGDPSLPYGTARPTTGSGGQSGRNTIGQGRRKLAAA